MSWIDRVWPVKQVSSKVGDKKDIPNYLWTKCLGCSEILFKDSLRKLNGVCSKCGFHHRISCKDRIELLTNGASYKVIGDEKTSKDYLNFVDTKTYKSRLQSAVDKTGNSESVMTVCTKMGDIGVVLAVFDFEFIGGSMGYVLGQRFVSAVDYALEHSLPFICVTASGGARMQEGVISLFQMAKTSMAIAKLKDSYLPYISLLVDPTSGGVAASMAMQADIIIAEKGALIGFTGPRVIAQTIKQKLPKGFQRAEFLLEHGAVDMVVDRVNMHDKVKKMLSFLLCNKSYSKNNNFVEGRMQAADFLERA